MAPAAARRDGADQRRVVVGVDGSPASRAALRWAAAQARASSATLVAVHTWEVPWLAYGGPLPIPPADQAATARAVLTRALADGLAGHPDQPVLSVVIQGRAGPTLVAEAVGADLLVVGSRGHGPLTGAVLGSVSEYCTTHSPCPVVVVRPSQPADADDGRTDPPTPSQLRAGSRDGAPT